MALKLKHRKCHSTFRILIAAPSAISASACGTGSFWTVSSGNDIFSGTKRVTVQENHFPCRGRNIVLFLFIYGRLSRSVLSTFPHPAQKGCMLLSKSGGNLAATHFSLYIDSAKSVCSNKSIKTS